MVTTEVIPFLCAIHLPYLLWQPLMSWNLLSLCFQGICAYGQLAVHCWAFLEKNSFQFLGHAKLCISSIQGIIACLQSKNTTFIARPYFAQAHYLFQYKRSWGAYAESNSTPEKRIWPCMTIWPLCMNMSFSPTVFLHIRKFPLKREIQK